MAKLMPPYTLCPLIEQRKCLGVCEDSVPGCVIVTLGKNIVIRYRLSDQKQVSFWSSKDKLSAPVIYDFNTKHYVGVFNSDRIALWSHSLVQLNKLKKFKFTRQIYSILSTKDCPPVIVYQNGIIGMLSDEMLSRKNPNDDEELFDDGEEIASSKIVLISSHLYVNLLTMNTKENIKRLHFIPIDPDGKERFSIRLENRCECSFNVHAVIEGEASSLITLWSDGNIYTIELPLKDVKNFPGRILSKIESVNLSQQVIMHSFGDQQLVLYGATSNSEGAVLCVFNLKYGLVDSSQKFKMYSETPKLWVVGTNRYILCLSGGHLVVVPTRFDSQKLSSLVGVAKISPDELNSSSSELSILAAKWTSFEEPDIVISEDEMDTDDNTLTVKILALRSAGFTDHMICEELLPQLVEESDEEGLMIFFSLISDVPDNWLIDLAIKFNQNKKSELLENILRRPLVFDNSSLQAVRTRVTMPIALDLLEIISNMLNIYPLDKSVLDWASLLLDSNYQQYLLSKDEKVIEIVKEMDSIVKLHLECMSNIKTLHAEIFALRKGHVQYKKNSISSHNYTVDTIKLY